MIEMVMGIFGICGVICLGCFLSWMMEMIYDNGDYRKRVTIEDLKEMSRLFDKDTAFVDYNDRGEKFYCGYIKD